MKRLKKNVEYLYCILKMSTDYILYVNDELDLCDEEFNKEIDREVYHYYNEYCKTFKDEGAFDLLFRKPMQKLKKEVRHERVG